MSSQCEQLRKEYEDLETLKKKFDSAVKNAERIMAEIAAKETRTREETEELKGALQRANKLKAELEKKRGELEEKLVPKEITAKWQNPETDEIKEAKINIEKETKYFKNFYEKFLNLKINEKEIRDIWRKNHKEIKQEMERYGYDTIFIIPENLPDCEELNEKLIETMKGHCLSCEGEHVNAYQGDNFKKGGSFKGVKNTEKPKLRIVLTKNIQNIYKSGDPIIEATLNKNIMQLTSLTEKEVKKRIKNQEPLFINFEADIKGKKIRIQTEGLSLDEYLVFQRSYFEKNQKHLDEMGWTWLLKSLSGPRLTYSCWGPDNRQFHVGADDPGASDDDLGVRPCRSFSV